MDWVLPRWLNVADGTGRMGGLGLGPWLGELRPDTGMSSEIGMSPVLDESVEKGTAWELFAVKMDRTWC